MSAAKVAAVLVSLSLWAAAASAQPSFASVQDAAGEIRPPGDPLERRAAGLQERELAAHRGRRADRPPPARGIAGSLRHYRPGDAVTGAGSSSAKLV